MRVKFVWFDLADDAKREQEEAEATIAELLADGWQIATPDFRMGSSGGSFTHHTVVVMLIKE